MSTNNPWFPSLAKDSPIPSLPEAKVEEAGKEPTHKTDDAPCDKVKCDSDFADPDEDLSNWKSDTVETADNDQKKSDMECPPSPDDQNPLCNLKAEIETSVDPEKRSLNTLITELLPNTQASKYVCPTQLHDKFCSKNIDNAKIFDNQASDICQMATENPCSSKAETVKSLNFETDSYKSSTSLNPDQTYEAMMFLLS